MNHVDEGLGVIDVPTVTVELAAQDACDLADALMAELDRRRDAELEEARS